MSEEQNTKEKNSNTTAESQSVIKPAAEAVNKQGGSQTHASKQKPAREGKKRRFSRDNREDDGFEQKIVDLARVTRVMKGGKRMRFRACLVVGNKAGKVGVGIAKAADVTNAITKAAEKAKKNTITVQIIDGTIAHNVNHKFGAAKIMLKPAPVGRGIIAGGAMRLVLELAGIKNVVGKNQGSNNKVNIVKCVVAALQLLKKSENKDKSKKLDKSESSAANEVKPDKDNK